MPIGDAEVVIEVPKGSLIKWRADGSVDFATPVPCPFNYGSVVGSQSPDGDPVDAIVLGPTLTRGRVAHWPVWGKVDFVDAGIEDPKWVCAATKPTEQDWRRIHRFFVVYAVAKRALNFLRGARGFTGVR